jgi:hypothetical protein
VLSQKPDLQAFVIPVLQLLFLQIPEPPDKNALYEIPAFRFATAGMTRKILLGQPRYKIVHLYTKLIFRN